MPYVVAAVIVVGLLCAVDLLLTIGVVRRLREHGERLNARPGSGHGARPGSMVAPFAATDVDGEPVNRELLADDTVVGFFSPGCGSCEELLPLFASEAARRLTTLAVVQGFPDERAAMVEALAPVARVVLEDPGKEVLSGAFGVSGFPAVFRVAAGGRVMAVGHDMAALAEPATEA